MSGLAATVTPHNCKYVLHSTNESVPYTGSLDIECGKEGEGIEISGPGCKITIPAQTGLGSVTLSNSGTGRARTIGASFNVSSMKYTASAGCPKKLSGSYENGALKGNSTIKGSDEEATYPIGVYLANEQVENPRYFKAEKYFSYVEGKGENGAGAPLFSTNIGNFNCDSTSRFIDAIWGPAAGISAATEFNGCTLAGAGIAVENHGCQFTYTLSGEAAGTARVALACPESNKMDLVWGACYMRVSPQEWPGAAKYENTGSGATREVTMNVSITSLKYEAINCPKGNGAFTGSFSAVWHVKGAGVEGSQLGLWIE